MNIRKRGPEVHRETGGTGLTKLRLSTKGRPMSGNRNDYCFKIILLGDNHVGKTKQLRRFTPNEFDWQGNVTIGVDFEVHRIHVNGKTIRAQIINTAGHECYTELIQIHYRGVKGAFVVYDITDHFAFAAMKHWLKELREYADNNIIIKLVGNKCDLSERRAVSTDEARAFANVHNLSFIETSALDGTNVEEAFTDLLTDIYQVESQKQNTDGFKGSSVVDISLQPTTGGQGGTKSKCFWKLCFSTLLQSVTTFSAVCSLFTSGWNPCQNYDSPKFCLVLDNDNDFIDV